MAWTTEPLALLGTMADSSVAKRVGLSVLDVRRKRIELKIPAWNPNALNVSAVMPIEPPKTQQPKKRAVRSRQDKRVQPITRFTHRWTDEQLNLLGTMPDETLAQRINIRSDEVRYMRIKLFINIYQL